MTDEEEYFHKLDQKAKAQMRAELEAESTAEELEKRRALHFFKCGKCGADMKTTTFRGVEIEVCESCGAVLLDPGELETLAGNDSVPTLRSLLAGLGVGGSQD